MQKIKKKQVNENVCIMHTTTEVISNIEFRFYIVMRWIFKTRMCEATATTIVVATASDVNLYTNCVAMHR